MPVIVGSIFVVVFVLGVLAARAQGQGPPGSEAVPVDRAEAMRFSLHMLAGLVAAAGLILGLIVLMAEQGFFHVVDGATVYAFLIWLATVVCVSVLVGLAFVVGQLDRLSRRVG